MFANSIGLSSKYLPILDAKYKMEAKTAVLDAAPNLVREGLTAKTIYLFKTAMQGLGDYARNTGYTQGDVTAEWQSHTFTQDRGRKFIVDRMDDVETMNQAFGTLAGEFIRTQVAPEVDAYRFATLFGNATTTVEANLTASTVDAAIEAGQVSMDEAEVPMEGRVLFVTPTIASLIRQSDNYTRNLNSDAQGGIDNRFEAYNGMRVIVVPQSRFYSAITLYDGVTGGQEAGGFIKTAVTGRDLNFMIVHPTASLGITKTAVPKIVSPEMNQDADAYIFGYRLYHDIFTPDNKTAGIYAHNKTT